MFEEIIFARELRNQIESGEIDIDDLTTDEREALEMAEIEAGRREYQATYDSYTAEW